MAKYIPPSKQAQTVLIGDPAYGQIEILKRGYLSNAEKKEFQQILDGVTDDMPLEDFYLAIAQSIANHRDPELVELIDQFDPKFPMLEAIYNFVLEENTAWRKAATEGE